MKHQVLRLWREDEGAVTIDFILLLPLFMVFFSWAFETGLLSTRHVMLQTGLNEVVRQIRLGIISPPDHGELIEAVCIQSRIIPDCENQLRLEMIATSVAGLAADSSAVTGAYTCRDRAEDDTAPLTDFVNTGTNNELMVLRVCALFDPLLPRMGIGQVLERESGDAYALTVTSAYVMEPFQ